MLISQSIFASGFQINEHGAKGMSLAGAFTGLANDASAVYYNPAGLSFLNGTNILGGVTIIMPTATWTAPGGALEEDMDAQTFTPINFYLTHQFSDKVSAGLSVNNQYGLGTLWDPTWAGRYLAYDTEIITFFISGVLSYKFSEQFSLAAGVTYAIGNVAITQVSNILVPGPSPFPDFQTKMEGDGNGLGFTFGLMYKPSEKVSLGLSFRSETKIEFEGDAVSTPASQPGVPDGQGGSFTLTYPTGNITAPLTTPMNITFGLGWLASEKVNVTADFQYVGWSSYDKLEVTFTEYAPPGGTPPTVASAERNWENSFILRAGCEYAVSNNFDLRGGLLYDTNPIKDEYVEPTLPDSDRLGINIGFGYDFGSGLVIDFAYMYLLFMEREITNSVVGFNGTYTNNAHLIGLNIGYAIN
jgi:long-chain fatty acid transport protein